MDQINALLKIETDPGEFISGEKKYYEVSIQQAQQTTSRVMASVRLESCTATGHCFKPSSPSYWQIANLLISTTL